MPLPAEDVLAIHDLIGRYNRAIDTGDADGWADCFLPDGVFDGVIGRFEGRAALHGLATAYWTEPEYEPWRGCQHWVNNVVVDGDGEGDAATLRCDHAMLKPDVDGGARIVLLASYHDRLARVDGRWRFVQRTVRGFPPGA